ncbi:GGDEF domain-containing protein [Ferrimonas senticii]|uniref:GGDEF domain-containing protein n=1 Tax=Ferrimonas senticii TaxID=394566 RepID=UPI0003FC3EF5|nr:sensor domain-containing diguanylate cyclase [Ferrimonas senticii]
MPLTLRSNIIALCLLGGLLLVAELVITKHNSIQQRLNQQHYRSITNDFQTIVDDRFNTVVLGTETFGNYLKLNDFNWQSMDSYAARLLRNYPAIDSIALAPNGVVQFIAPLAGNEGAIGHDILADDKRKIGVTRALNRSKIIIVGPVKLIQSGQLAFIIRRPIFDLDGHCWGLSSAVISLDSFIDEVAPQLASRYRGNFAIYGDHPDIAQQYQVYQQGVVDDSNITLPLAVFDSKWTVVFATPKTPLNRQRAIGFTLAVAVWLMLIVGKQRRQQRASADVAALKNGAYQDFLTGLHNRRWLTDCVLAKQPHYRGTLVMIDIDHFKSINDHHGHAIGDQVLQKFAHFLSQRLRQQDRLLRWGGEEFLLLMDNVDAEAAHDILQRLLHQLADHRLLESLPTLIITFSAGIRQCQPTNDFEDELHRADLALYRAKQQGRNRCVIDRDQ